MFKTLDFYAFFSCIVLAIALMLYLFVEKITFTPQYINESQLITLKGSLSEKPTYKKSEKLWYKRYEIRFKLNEFPTHIFYSQQKILFDFAYTIGDSIQIQIASSEFQKIRTNHYPLLFNRDVNQIMLYGIKINNFILFNYIDANESERKYYKKRLQRYLLFSIIVIVLIVLFFYIFKKRKVILAKWKV